MAYKVWEQLVKKELGLNPSNREAIYKDATKRYCSIDVKEPGNRLLVEKLKIILARMPDHQAKSKLQIAWRKHKNRHT